MRSPSPLIKTLPSCHVYLRLKNSPSTRYSAIFTVPKVAPGVQDFVPQLLLVAHHLFLVLEHSCMIRPAPAADGYRAGEGQPLTTFALDDDALGAPPVNPAELHLLYLVVPPGSFDDALIHGAHPDTSFPPRRICCICIRCLVCYYCSYVPYHRSISCQDLSNWCLTALNRTLIFFS